MVSRGKERGARELGRMIERISKGRNKESRGRKERRRRKERKEKKEIRES